MRHNFEEKYKNITLRQLCERDLEFLRNWRNDAENTRFLRKIPYITQEMQNKWFSSYLDDENEIIFAIDENIIVKNVVGSISLYDIRGKQAEVGKILVGEPKAHGLDVCVNALKAIMSIAKKELLLNCLILHVYKENIPAIRAYKKAGFIITNENVNCNGMVEYVMEIAL